MGSLVFIVGASIGYSLWRCYRARIFFLKLPSTYPHEGHIPLVVLILFVLTLALKGCTHGSAFNDMVTFHSHLIWRKISCTASSALIPFLSASKLRIILCCSAGGATASTSCVVTYFLP